MTNQARNEDAPRGPTHVLFHIEDRGRDAKGFWTEIAAGWENQDGSINLVTHVGAVLLPGHRYQLRTRPARIEVAESER